MIETGYLRLRVEQVQGLHDRRYGVVVIGRDLGSTQFARFVVQHDQVRKCAAHVYAGSQRHDRWPYASGARAARLPACTIARTCRLTSTLGELVTRMVAIASFSRTLRLSRKHATALEQALVECACVSLGRSRF